MAVIQRYRNKLGRFDKPQRRKLLRKELVDTKTKRVLARSDLESFGKISDVKRRLKLIEPTDLPPEIDPVRYEEQAAIQFTIDLDRPFWDQVKENVIDLPGLEEGDALQLDISAHGARTLGRLIPAGTLNQVVEMIVMDIGAYLDGETGDSIRSPRLLLGPEPAGIHTNRTTIKIKLVVLRDRVRKGTPLLRDLE